MTQKDLSQLYWLNREIERDQERLEELRAKAYPSISYDRGFHGKGEMKDSVGRLAMFIIEQELLIQTKQTRAYIEQNRLYRFIATVEDSLMRQILQLRYINGLTWKQIAFEIGEYDEQFPRKKCKAFLKKLDEKDETKGL